MAPPGLLILVRWSKMLLCISRAPVLFIREVKGYPADPVAAFKELLSSSPTLSLNKPLFTMQKDNNLITVTVPMLTKALNIILDARWLDSSMFSLHSLHHGGATLVHRQDLDQIDIKDMDCGPAKDCFHHSTTVTPSCVCVVCFTMSSYAWYALRQDERD